MAIPTSVPMPKLKIVAIPMSPMVQGTALARTSLTLAGKLLIEMPKLPEAVFPRYLQYWTQTDVSVSIPKAARTASTESRSAPWRLCTKTLTGSPGIKRGRTKLIVIAAYSAKKNQKSFRIKYFIEKRRSCKRSQNRHSRTNTDRCAISRRNGPWRRGLADRPKIEEHRNFCHSPSSWGGIGIVPAGPSDKPFRGVLEPCRIKEERNQRRVSQNRSKNDIHLL